MAWRFVRRSRHARGDGILDAAAEVFSEQGYTARLSDIADRAGMKAGSLYYHFDSPGPGCRGAAIGDRRAWDHVAAAVGRLPSTATPLDRLEAAIRAHTLSIVGRSRYATAQTRIVGSLPPDLARAHRKDQRAYGDYWRDLFDATRRAGLINGEVDLFVAQMLAFGAMNWTSEWYRPDSGHDSRDTRRSDRPRVPARRGDRAQLVISSTEARPPR